MLFCSSVWTGVSWPPTRVPLALLLPIIPISVEMIKQPGLVTVETQEVEEQACHLGEPRKGFHFAAGDTVAIGADRFISFFLSFFIYSLISFSLPSFTSVSNRAWHHQVLPAGRRISAQSSTGWDLFIWGIFLMLYFPVRQGFCFFLSFPTHTSSPFPKIPLPTLSESGTLISLYYVKVHLNMKEPHVFDTAFLCV